MNNDTITPSSLKFEKQGSQPRRNGNRKRRHRAKLAMIAKQNEVKKAQLKAAGERKHEKMIAKQRAHKEYTEYLKARKNEAVETSSQELEKEQAV